MQAWKLVALATALVSLASCGQKSQDTVGSNTSGQNIVGGSTVDSSDPVASSTVALVFDIQSDEGSGQALCTGTLVAKDIVMTAAHCVQGAVDGGVIFALDAQNADQSALRIITAVDVNPDYAADAASNRNDVALVKFTGDVPAGYKIAKLATSKTKAQDGDEVILAGYGASSMSAGGDPQGAAVLREATVHLTRYDYSDDEMLFAQDNGRGACHGDSGGPAYVKNSKGDLVVLGITSTAADEAGASTCMTGSLYEKVAVMNKYVKAGIKRLAQSSGNSTIGSGSGQEDDN